MLKSKVYDLFVSYSRNIDLKIIEKLIFDLNEYNIEVWYDRNEIILGSDIYIEFDTLLREIKNWKGCIVFFDKSYFFKEWCMKELDAILSNNIHMLPILYDVSKDYLFKIDKRLMRYNFFTLNQSNNSLLVNKILDVIINKSNISKITILPCEIWNILYHDYILTSNNIGLKIIKADTLATYIRCKYKLNYEQLRLLNIIKIKNNHFIKYDIADNYDIKICISIIEKILQPS